MTPIDLPVSGGLHNWFYYQVTGRDAVQIKSMRLRRFIGRLPPALVMSSAEAVGRVAADKRAIAYVDTRSVDASVKVVMRIQTPTPLDRLVVLE